MSPARQGDGRADEEELRVSVEGSALTVTFNRPSQHNAMTWHMYDGLVAACERADADDRVRSMVLTGAGEKAFVAGTDIAQFAGFDGADGVDYEARVEAILGRLAQVTKPTIAAVRGHCAGAGIALAATCDLRVATPSARFAVPIARTLGNCLAAGPQALLIHHLGPSRTMDLLLTARAIPAEEAAGAGFVNRFVGEDELERATRDLTEHLAGYAPLTMWAAKTTTRRILESGVPDNRDVIERIYGSADFREGVAGFTSGRQPRWRGH